MNARTHSPDEFEKACNWPLQLFFSTHDVTLCGWRLRELVRCLRAGKLAAVRTAKAGYLNLRAEAPFVTEIKIAPARIP